MNRNRKVVRNAIIAGAIAVTATVAATGIARTGNETVKDPVVITSQTVENDLSTTAGVTKQIGAVTFSSLKSQDIQLIPKEVQRVSEGEEEEPGLTAGLMTDLFQGDGTTAEAPQETAQTGAINGELIGAAGAASLEGILADENALVVENSENLTAEAEEAPAATEDDAAQAVAGEAASPESVPAHPEWAGKLMAVVEDSLNVRETPGEEGTVIGKLYAGAVADIVEVGDTWTHILSGSVDGYVRNDLCVFGEDAYNYAEQVCPVQAVTTTGGVRFRTAPGEDAGILSSLEEGAKLTVRKDAETVEGWIPVSYNGSEGFVAADYVATSVEYGTAVTVEEEQAKIAAEQAEKAESEQVQNSAGPTQSASTAANVDEVTLLAALIQCEAGSQPYEGQVAVGNVVVNRLHTGAYGGSISSVIYAPGQFSPAGSGAVARVAAGGVSGTALAAAQAALNGENYVGGCLHFRNVACGHPGTVIGSHVFW